MTRPRRKPAPCALSDERDRQLELRLAEEADPRHEDALVVHRVTHDDAGRVIPSHAERGVRRWGPSGRARFGDLRPGDFKGPGRVA